MPSLTSRQHRAMMAAAFGHSTLGIPQSVGQDFAAADRGHTFKGNIAAHVDKVARTHKVHGRGLSIPHVSKAHKG